MSEAPLTVFYYSTNLQHTRADLFVSEENFTSLDLKCLRQTGLTLQEYAAAHPEHLYRALINDLLFIDVIAEPQLIDDKPQPSFQSLEAHLDPAFNRILFALWVSPDEVLLNDSSALEHLSRTVINLTLEPPALG